MFPDTSNSSPWTLSNFSFQPTFPFSSTGRTRPAWGAVCLHAGSQCACLQIVMIAHLSSLLKNSPYSPSLSTCAGCAQIIPTFEFPLCLSARVRCMHCLPCFPAFTESRPYAAVPPWRSHDPSLTFMRFFPSYPDLLWEFFSN